MVAEFPVAGGEVLSQETASSTALTPVLSQPRLVERTSIFENTRQSFPILFKEKSW